MARTFNDCSDAELGQILRSRYDRLCAAHDAGLSDEHPDETWARDTETLKAYREAAATGGVAGKVAGSDNPPATPGAPKPPVAGKDSAAGGTYVRGLDQQLRYVPHGGRMLPGDVAVSVPRSVPSTGGSQRAMAAAISGYTRIK